jgi:hypothetical protein
MAGSRPRALRAVTVMRAGVALHQIQGVGVGWGGRHWKRGGGPVLHPARNDGPGAPSQARLLFRCAMAETPAVHRNAPVSSAAKAHNVFDNDNQPKIGIRVQIANELFLSSRFKLSILSVDLHSSFWRSFQLTGIHAHSCPTVIVCQRFYEQVSPINSALADSSCFRSARAKLAINLSKATRASQKRPASQQTENSHV